MADKLKIPPHSDEAEGSIIGALLIDKDAIGAVAGIINADDFYDDRNRDVYSVCLSLFENRTPIDLLTVTEGLKKKKLLTVIGGVARLTELVNAVPTSAHVEHYAKIVKGFATKRSLAQSASRIVEMSFDESMSAEDVLDKAESNVFALAQRTIGKSFMAVRDALAESFDRLDELYKNKEGIRGVATGFPDLDDCLAGFQKSNLIVLAARPSVGKSAFALNIAQYIAVNDKRPVAIFSLEMSKEELVDRLLVAQADIDAWKLKTGKLTEEDFTALSNAMGVLAEAPIYIDDTPALSILEMRTKARRLQVDVGIDLIIVDYLQLARSRNLENRVQEVGEISQGLKNLARELKVPVLALSQLSRAVEARGEKRPQLSDLRESGCLTGDTEIILSSGERKSLMSLVGKRNFGVFSLTKGLKIETAKVSRVFPSGKKMVFKITFRSGRVIKASGNHPFYKLGGWVRADALELKDRVAIPRILKALPKDSGKISDDRLIVLAHLIGDGCFVKQQPLHYTNSEMELIKIVKKSAEREFAIKPRIVKQENWYHLYLASAERLARGRRNPIVRWLDEELRIYGQHSREKFVPEQICVLSDQKIALFLKHLWSTDGCISVQRSSKRKVSLYYASGSERLARDVQHLLLRLGILSTLTTSSKKGYEDIWNVHVQGKSQQLAFIEKIGFVGIKAQKVHEAVSFLNGIVENLNNDVIPREIWLEIEELRRENGLSTREFQKRVGWAYSGTQRQKNGISRERMRKILKVISNQHLLNLCDSDLYWDEIKSVEKVGIQEVFDLTVPGVANFVANDILVHNSIEQDSDVVMFLYREEDDNLENIALDIAKHRNGPLRNIKLRFKGDRIRFYSRDTKH